MQSMLVGNNIELTITTNGEQYLVLVTEVLPFRYDCVIVTPTNWLHNLGNH